MHKNTEADICLRCGDWEAVVLPDFGMNMVSLRYRGDPVLREPNDREALGHEPYTHGIPLLFPANRTESGKFTFNGTEYSLPLNEPQRGNHIHGQMFDAPFTVYDTDSSSVTAVYNNTGERYPFPFDMTVTDKLSEYGLKRTIALKNTGNSSMPYTMAFHTTFNEPKRFSAPIGQRFLCNRNYIPTGDMLTLTETEAQYNLGINPSNLVISGFYTATGHCVKLGAYRLNVSENFDEWVLFNGGGGQGFLCVEPQCGEVNGLNRPYGHRVLNAGEETVFCLEIKLGVQG